MLPTFECELLIAKPSWMATQNDILTKELLVAEEDDIRKASFLKIPKMYSQSLNAPIGI